MELQQLFKFKRKQARFASKALVYPNVLRIIEHPVVSKGALNFLDLVMGLDVVTVEEVLQLFPLQLRIHREF